MPPFPEDEDPPHRADPRCPDEEAGLATSLMSATGVCSTTGESGTGDARATRLLLFFTRFAQPQAAAGCGGLDLCCCCCFPIVGEEGIVADRAAGTSGVGAVGSVVSARACSQDFSSEAVGGVEITAVEGEGAVGTAVEEVGAEQAAVGEVGVGQAAVGEVGVRQAAVGEVGVGQASAEELGGPERLATGDEKGGGRPRR